MKIRRALWRGFRVGLVRSRVELRRRSASLKSQYNKKPFFFPIQISVAVFRCWFTEQVCVSDSVVFFFAVSILHCRQIRILGDVHPAWRQLLQSSLKRARLLQQYKRRNCIPASFLSGVNLSSSPSSSYKNSASVKYNIILIKKQQQQNQQLQVKFVGLQGLHKT